MIKKKQYIHIAPGEYRASNGDVVLGTLLGSCVAICLYDPIRRVVGMNHIMLSRETLKEDGRACRIRDGRIGICGMELLIGRMLAKGAVRRNLRAKAFGGASMFRHESECRFNYCVGQDNIRFVREYLRDNHIPIEAEDMGGSSGRLIRFRSNDFSVWVKTLDSLVNNKILQQEQQGWQNLEKDDVFNPRAGHGPAAR